MTLQFLCLTLPYLPYQYYCYFFFKKGTVAGLEAEMVPVEARLKTFPGDGRKVNPLSPADFLPAEILT